MSPQLPLQPSRAPPQVLVCFPRAVPTTPTKLTMPLCTHSLITTPNQTSPALPVPPIPSLTGRGNK
ncbi:hypothetical protein E2C01_013707 [Portunus trituberculatus]|uniref:Uncharacterized protein n=1 Tax=Portunus trituberculatus TaxID=210409 RepID=A0A5B7DHC8_PORTR|nr:hypothetical protein [Portunus trituberculatus]